MKTEPAHTSPKRAGIHTAAVEMFSALLESHLDEAMRDACDSFISDAPNDAPVVKMGFTVEFEPLAESPEVSVKVAWSVRRKDEASQVVDADQAKIDFEKAGADAS